MNKTQFLQDQLNKAPEDSKKWRMAELGLKGLIVGFVISALIIVLKPAVATQIMTLAQIFMTAWSAVVGIYLGAQGTVDYKSTSALQSAHEQT